VLAIGSDPDVGRSLNVPYDFLTPRNDEELVAAYQRASIFVTCSHEEGFGLTPLEAMSCGTPVVCADSGGVRDFARDGENCLMVPARDIKAISAAIIQLLGSSELRTKLMAGGQKTAAQFDWSVIGRQYEKLFLTARERVR
jgi:glycosyltransferase involved in cell wall biosynthesis